MPRILTRSSSNFSVNTRRSSGMESSRADDGDMVVATSLLERVTSRVGFPPSLSNSVKWGSSCRGPEAGGCGVPQPGGFS